MPTYDVKLGDPDDATNFLPLMLYEDAKHPKEIRSSFQPAAPAGGSTEDETISDWSNGMGHSHRGDISNGYGYGEFVDTRSPDHVIAAGAVTELAMPLTVTGNPQILGEFTLNGDYYTISTRYLFKQIDGVGDPVVELDLGAETFDGTVVVADYAGARWAFLGHATTQFSMYDGTTHVRTLSFQRFALTAVYFTTPAGVSVRHLVACDTDYSVKTCPLTSDPLLAASWSAQIIVGEGAYPVKRISSAGRMVYISTTGGLYIMNELQETLAITPYHQEGADSENGLRAMVYDRYCMYVTVLGVDAVDISQTGYRHASPNWVTPGAASGLPNESPIWGRATSQAFDGGWYVQSTFNGRDSYIMYAMPREKLGIPGQSPWIWHGAFAKFTNQKVSHLRVRSIQESGVRARYLYISTEPYDANGASRLFKQSLPRSSSAIQEYDALTAGTISVPHRFYPGWTLVNTPLEAGAATREKTMYRVDIGTENLTGGNSMAVSVSEDRGAYTTVGVATVSPLHPIPCSDSAPQGLDLTVKVEASGTATVPVILRSITTRSAVNHEQVEMLDMDVLLAKGQKLGNQAHANRASDLVAWRQLVSKQNSIQTLTVMPVGEEMTVLVEPEITSSIRPIEPSQGAGSKGWGRVAHVRMRLIGGGVSRYDESLYDLDNYG